TVGRTEKVEYDRHDRPIRKRVCLDATAPEGNDAPTCTTWLSETELLYDSEDRVVETKVYGSESDGGGIDQLLGWTRTVYDARGRAYEKQVAQAAQAVVPADPQWLATRTGYDALDRVVTAATPDGSGGWNISTVEYDALGRKVKATDAAGNELLLTRNAMGLVIRREVKENANDPGGGSIFKTDFEYDALGRVVKVLLADPVSGEPSRPVTRSYDVQSRVIAQWLPGNSAASGEAYETETIYDGLGRKVQVRKHSGLSAHSDGWQEVFYDYDAAGRLTAIRVDPDGSGPAAEQQTRYEYDAQGRQTLRIMPDGREQRTEYDSISRVEKTVYASASGTCSAGGTGCVELASTWDQAGRRTALTASLNGADPTHYNLAAGGSQTQSWTYDGLGRILEARDDNASGAEAVVSYSYDTLSRVLTSGWDEDANGDALWTITAGYDSAGRLESVEYPSVAAPHYAGPTLRYAYDALGRVTSLTDLHGAGPEDDESVIEAAYTGATRLRELKHSDGTLWRSHDGSQELRDAAGRSTGAQVVAPTVGDVWFEEQISYDDNDRVTRVAWPHGRIAAGESEAQEYTMDELGRLVEFEQGQFANGSLDTGALTAQHEWRLDELGNWREHRGDPADSFLTPGLDIVNAYTDWPVPFDDDGDGTPDVLARTHDAVRGFLYHRGEIGGG
ncbi:MAG TPA: RHS repeat protein, partial [Acidobacteria bacterium]|nr:RHS repeat protein [Acidobacteriota bacterium]